MISKSRSLLVGNRNRDLLPVDHVTFAKEMRNFALPSTLEESSFPVDQSHERVQSAKAKIIHTVDSASVRGHHTIAERFSQGPGTVPFPRFYEKDFQRLLEIKSKRRGRGLLASQAGRVDFLAQPSLPHPQIATDLLNSVTSETQPTLKEAIRKSNRLTGKLEPLSRYQFNSERKKASWEEEKNRMNMRRFGGQALTLQEVSEAVRRDTTMGMDQMYRVSIREKKQIFRVVAPFVDQALAPKWTTPGTDSKATESTLADRRSREGLPWFTGRDKNNTQLQPVVQRDMLEDDMENMVQEPTPAAAKQVIRVVPAPQRRGVTPSSANSGALTPKALTLEEPSAAVLPKRQGTDSRSSHRSSNQFSMQEPQSLDSQPTLGGGERQQVQPAPVISGLTLSFPSKKEVASPRQPFVFPRKEAACGSPDREHPIQFHKFMRQ